MESVWPFPMSEMVMIRFVEILGDTDFDQDYVPNK